MRTIYRWETNGLYMEDRPSVFSLQTVCFSFIRVVCISVLHCQPVKCRYSFQVVGFVEIAFGVALCTAQMDKVDAVGKLLHDDCTIVGAAYTERTGAETKSVALVGNGIYQCLEIGSAAHNARQAEDGAGWIIRMDNQLYTGFVGNRSDFLQEVDQVGTQRSGVMPL